MIGQRIGHYRIERILGNGGMGVVYEAVHANLGHRVAVKTLKPELCANKKYRERFLREARAYSQVQHPGLVKIIDFGELDDGQLYILMEYLEGVTLRERLKRVAEERLPIAAALHLVQQVATAMAVIHQCGIVHRDIKPENIMLSIDSATAMGERAIVLDFGIAKFIGAKALPTLTTTGVPGTPIYMAPERCRSDDNVDGKSDVYALGCVFYELLCGRPPFEDAPENVMMMQVYGEPLPPRERVPEIPPAVQALILHMLRKDPSARPDMAAIAAQIRYILSSSRRLHASSLRAWFRRKLPRRTSGTMFAWLAGMLSLLVLLLFAISYFWPLPEMRRIEGGTFAMGIDQQELDAAGDYVRNGYEFYLEKGYLQREQPKHMVKLSSFMLDTTEVTNERFTAWLKALKRKEQIVVEKYLDANGKSADLVYLIVPQTGQRSRVLIYNLFGGLEYNGIAFENGQFAVRHGMERRPVSAVTWEGANRYCISQGKRLPTEAEWEFAARSRGVYRFPWGDNLPDCDHAVIERGPVFGACRKTHRPALPDVASAPKDQTAQGVFDMAGSVTEWVADRFRIRYESCVPFCQDPIMTEEGKTLLERGRWVIRGSAWSMDFPAARATSRTSAVNRTDADTGMRCARSIK